MGTPPCHSSTNMSGWLAYNIEMMPFISEVRIQRIKAAGQAAY